jgi:hypothetical protein
MRQTIVSYDDIDTQLVERLPERETLFININVSPVIGVNLAVAINAATINGAASAYATQTLTTVLG